MLYKLPNKKARGFTLIELLVSIGIMVLLFSLGFANYREFAKRQELQNVMKETRVNLRQAQEQSTAGEKPVGCTTLNGYTVRRTSPTRYIVEADCDNATYEMKAVEYLTKYPDITFGVFPDFTFNVLADGVSSDVTITITQTSTGDVGQVEITSAGEIK